MQISFNVSHESLIYSGVEIITFNLVRGEYTRNAIDDTKMHLCECVSVCQRIGIV